MDDPVAQCTHRENAERMLLASFVSGLVGTPGTQVQYANVQSLSEATNSDFCPRGRKARVVQGEFLHKS
jgi:hypothetical protein